MRVEGFAVVKNEADIIEAFVRHHTALLDRLYVVDNGSTDDTKRILAALSAEGLPVVVAHDDSPSHPQADIVTAFVAGLSDSPDWLFLLDADEFVDCGSRDDLRAILARQSDVACLLVRWSFMVPTEDDDRSIDNPVIRIRHRRLGATDPFLSKLVLPRRYLGRDQYRVANGSHFLIGVDGVAADHRELTEVRLAHFPVRSPEQLARKVVVGSWAVLARPTRLPTEVFHWHELRRRVMARRPLTVADARMVAQNYAGARWTEHPLEVDPLAVPGNARLTYTHPGEDGWRQYAVDFADAHFRRLAGQVLTAGPVTVGKTVHGITAFPTDEGDGRVLAGHGDVAPDLNSLLLSWARPKDVVLHAGAGIGYRTVIAAQRVGPRGHVIAWGGDERLLPTNLVLHNLTNVELLPHGELPADTRLDLIVWESPLSEELLHLATTVADRAVIRVADARTGAEWVRELTGRGLSARSLEVNAVPARPFVDPEDEPVAAVTGEIWQLVVAARSATALAEIAPR